MRRCSSTSSYLLRAWLGLTIILIALLALLPARKLVTIETSCLGDQIQATQDGADSLALVHYVACPPVSREVFYLVLATAVCFSEFPIVSNRFYRGPPVLS